MSYTKTTNGYINTIAKEMKEAHTLTINYLKEVDIEKIVGDISKSMGEEEMEVWLAGLVSVEINKDIKGKFYNNCKREVFDNNVFFIEMIIYRTIKPLVENKQYMGRFETKEKEEKLACFQQKNHIKKENDVI